MDSKQLKDLVSAIISQDVVLLKQPEVVKQANVGKKSTAGKKRQTKNSIVRTSGTKGGPSNPGQSGSVNKKRKRNSGMIH